MPRKAIEASARRFAAFLREGRDQDFARPLTRRYCSSMPVPITGFALASGALYGRRLAHRQPRAGHRHRRRADIASLRRGGGDGGVHGMGRTGGNSTTAPIVFGRIADTEAAAPGWRGE